MIFVWKKFEKSNAVTASKLGKNACFKLMVSMLNLKMRALQLQWFKIKITYLDFDGQIVLLIHATSVCQLPESPSIMYHISHHN